MKNLILLAKELGFKARTITTRYTFDSFFNNKKEPYLNDMCNYTLLCEIHKWIRDKYLLTIKVEDFIDSDDSIIDWDYEISKIGTDLTVDGAYIPLIGYSYDDYTRRYKTYEEAFEAGILKALKLKKDEQLAEND